MVRRFKEGAVGSGLPRGCGFAHKTKQKQDAPIGKRRQ